MNGEIVVLQDGSAIGRRMAEWLPEEALATRGAFSPGLSGGSTPRILYPLLASSVFRDRLSWGRAHPFSGDERSGRTTIPTATTAWHGSDDRPRIDSRRPGASLADAP